MRAENLLMYHSK